MEDLKQQFVFAENVTNRVFKEVLEHWQSKSFYHAERKSRYFTFRVNYMVQRTSMTYMAEVALECANKTGFEDEKFLSLLFKYCQSLDFEPYQFLVICSFMGSYCATLNLYGDRCFAFYSCRLISGLIMHYQDKGQFTGDGWELLDRAAQAYGGEDEQFRVDMLKTSDLFMYLRTEVDVPCLNNLKPKPTINVRIGKRPRSEVDS